MRPVAVPVQSDLLRALVIATPMSLALWAMLAEIVLLVSARIA